MALRIAIGGVVHESNTFCHPTPLTAFRELDGAAILDVHRGVRAYVGGMLDGIDEVGAVAVPCYHAEAQPGGTIRRDAFRAMCRRLVERLAAARPNAVCLALHGAGVAEGAEDVETEVVAAVRAAVGDGVPIAATLDLHGNLRHEMLRYGAAFFPVRLYPHSDSYDRGVEAVRCLSRWAAGGPRPETALVRLPLLLFSHTSDLDPVRAINAYCAEWEARPGIAAVRFMHGFCHTDIPDMGASVVAVATAGTAAANEAAQDVARHVWSRRAEFPSTRPEPEEAVRLALRALASHGGPVVINDTSDNPGGGGPGDGTHLLRAMTAARHPLPAAFAYIHDPEAAARCHAAGEGATLELALGGRTYPINGPPVTGPVRVVRLTDGRFILSTPMGRGQRVDLGPMARVAMGGVDVLVGSVRTQVLDAEMFALHGIDVRRCGLVAVKSANHFRAGFRDIATEIITADSPGITTGRLDTLPYRRRPRPMYPLEAVSERPV